MLVISKMLLMLLMLLNYYTNLSKLESDSRLYILLKYVDRSKTLAEILVNT
jgi:hypothetical protein